MRGAAFARARSADDLGAHRLHLLGVEAALAAGDALDDHPGRGVEQDAQAFTLLSSTIFCAAAQAFAPGSIPFSFRILRPSSSRVPLRRTTNGSCIFKLSRADTSPLATSSPRVMPPKTFIRTPFTRGFIKITAR